MKKGEFKYCEDNYKFSLKYYINNYGNMEGLCFSSVAWKIKKGIYILKVKSALKNIELSLYIEKFYAKNVKLQPQDKFQAT
jgi:hypothetical protein